MAWTNRGVGMAAALVLSVAAPSAAAQDRAIDDDAPTVDACRESIASLGRDVDVSPSLVSMLRLGRCQVTLGRVVEGLDNLRWVARQPLASDASEALPRDAELQQRARRLIEQNERRVASLKIAVAAPREADVTVEIDGNPVAFANLANARRVDPGEHLIVAKAPGYRTVFANVSLRDGGIDAVALVLELELELAASWHVTPAAAAASAPVARRANRVPAWIAFGVSGATMSVGAVLGVLTLGKADQIHATCTGATCPAASRGALDSAHAYANAATGMFVVSGLSALVGTALVIWPPSSPEREKARANTVVRPLLGVGSAGVAGTF